MVVCVHNPMGMWLGIVSHPPVENEPHLKPTEWQLGKPAQVMIVNMQRPARVPAMELTKMSIQTQMIIESSFMVMRLPADTTVISIEKPAFWYEVVQRSGVYEKYMEIIQAEIDQVPSNGPDKEGEKYA